MGYAVPGNSDGCASPGYAFKDGERLLPIVSSAKGTVPMILFPPSVTKVLFPSSLVLLVG